MLRELHIKIIRTIGREKRLSKLYYIFSPVLLEPEIVVSVKYCWFTVSLVIKYLLQHFRRIETLPGKHLSHKIKFLLTNKEIER